MTRMDLKDLRLPILGILILIRPMMSLPTSSPRMGLIMTKMTSLVASLEGGKMDKMGKKGEDLVGLEALGGLVDLAPPCLTMISSVTTAEDSVPLPSVQATLEGGWAVLQNL